MAKLRKSRTSTPAKSARWIHGFVITGESGTNYKISFDKAQMCWVCSCRGAIAHGQCKHMTACGLEGRKYGRQKSIPTKTPDRRRLSVY